MAHNSPKVKDLEQLSELLAGPRKQHKKVVMCHGVFDPLHIGHIRHFEQAKKLGDILVVSVTPDKYVNKGPHRPVFTEDLRVEAIAALGCVDYASVNSWPTAEKTIRLLRPDYYVKGSEYEATENDRTGGIVSEKEAISAVGGQIAFTNDITFSASNLVNQHLQVFPPEVSGFLSSFTGRYSTDQVLGYLDRARDLKVLVIGETIIDEYVYCQSLGKSGKEPVLATRHLSSEKFAGGIVAVANHVSGFCDRVGMLTVLGNTDSQEDFIRGKMSTSIDGIFLYMEGKAPTIVKKRFVEAYPFQKLFELYEMEDDGDEPAQAKALCDSLERLLPDYDVVVVTDYGHGMLVPEAVELLCSSAPFLAVNTQANAGNRGFNTISKYGRADYICLSEAEIRLEVRNRSRSIEDIILDVSDKLSCDQMVITQGQKGSLSYGRDQGFFKIPVFTTTIADRIGAGDAVLSVTALCAAQKAPIEVSGFIGNVAGAQAVATVGHRESIKHASFCRHVETLMK